MLDLEHLLFTNSPSGDFVESCYPHLLNKASTVFVASPYVTRTAELVEAATKGKTVSLVVGLNTATSPTALRATLGIPNLSVRFYTSRFHAKVFVFDDCALVGSSNLTSGGLHDNREATLYIDDGAYLEEIVTFSQELWSNAAVLTTEILNKFEKTRSQFGDPSSWDRKIEDALGKQEPPNISIKSQRKTSEYRFLEPLRQRVYERFRPAFNEVASFLQREGLQRPEWNANDVGSETNRFLNWVRLVPGAAGEWERAPLLREQSTRAVKLMEVAKEWSRTKDPRIEDDYFVNLSNLRNIFASEDALDMATRDQLSGALMCIHAFEEQIRFVSGGYSMIIEHFWSINKNDIKKVKRSLRHLVFGKAEFIERLYEVLNEPEWKIAKFARSCALELTGTVRPEVCPPMNGRSAKGLRYLGFDVPPN